VTGRAQWFAEGATSGQLTVVDPDIDYGAAPQPDPGLADRMEELAGCL
jgi:hypothetical protein